MKKTEEINIALTDEDMLQATGGLDARKKESGSVYDLTGIVVSVLGDGEYSVRLNDGGEVRALLQAEQQPAREGTAVGLTAFAGGWRMSPA